MKRYICAAVLLLVLITAGVRAESNVAPVESATPLKQIKISSLSVTPKVITQNQIVDFALEIKNTGNMATDIEPEIEIYLDSSLVEKINFTPHVLAAGSNMSLFRDHLVTLGVGEYRVVAKVYYDNRSYHTSEVGTLSIVAEHEKVGEGDIKNDTPHLRVWFFPVLIEGKPGDSSAVSFELENPSEKEIRDIKISIEGIPRGWVTLQPQEVTIRGNESVGLNIAISVPNSALPGDRRAVLRVKSAKEEAIASFIFRIKPYPLDFEKPAVLRKVYLNEKEGKALVSVEVENSGVRVGSIEILEEIPKEIASSVEEINFKTPVAVLEADPLVAWRLSEVDPYEVYTLEYEVGSIAARYSPYIYWPLRQVNVFYTSVSGIELLQFSGALAAYAVPGKESEVKLRITNPTLEAMNLTFKLVAHPGWEVSPPEITKLLLPGYAQELVFTVKPPRDAPPGSYTILARAFSEDGEVSQPLTLILQEEPRRINLRKFLIPALSLGALLLLVYTAIHIYRKRRVYRREVVEAVGRIKSSMEEE